MNTTDPITKLSTSGQKGNLMILIVIVILLMVGGMSIYFYTQQKKVVSDHPNVNQQKTNILPSPSVTQSNNSKTYSDLTYQYSFQYPDTWFTEESTQQFQTWDCVVNILSSTGSRISDVTGTLSIWKPNVAGRKIDIQSFLEKPPSGGFKEAKVGVYKSYRADEVKEGKTNITLFFEKDSRIFQLTFVILDGPQRVANTAIVEEIINSLKFN